MLSRRVFSRLSQAVRLHRHVTTGSAAITSPLNYLDGKRVQAVNTQAEDDLPVLEPHTGNPQTPARIVSMVTMNWGTDSERAVIVMDGKKIPSNSSAVTFTVQGCKNRVSVPPVSAVRTTENEYTGVHADNQVLPTFEILILAYILSFHDE